MKKIFTLLTLLLLSNLVFGQHYTFDEITQGGSTGTDKIYDICLDAAGNKFVAGTFQNTVDFGNGVSITAVDNADCFVAKYDVDGNILWANGFGGYLTDYSDAIAVDNDGNVITASHFYKSVVFGTDTLISAGTWDIAVVKFDSDGNYLWMKQAYTENKDEAEDIKVDSEGNYVLLGYFDAADSLTLPLKYDSLEILGHGERDLFVLKMDTDGNPLWGVSAGGFYDDDDPGDLVIDENDNIYFTGTYEDTSGNFGTIELPYVDGKEVFTAKLTSTGTYEWAVAATGLGDDVGTSLDYIQGTDLNPGIVLVTGYFETSISVGNELFESAGNDDIFAFAFTDAGVYDGGFSFGSDGEDQAKAINSIKGDGGGYYISGETRGDIIVAGDTLENHGYRDMLVMRMYEDSLVWAKNYGGTNYDDIYAAAINDDGVIYFAGTFKSSPADFGLVSLISKGSYDLWIGQMQDHSVVYFECNLAVQITNGTFDPAEDAVYVRGNFQEDARDDNGNWNGNYFQLFDEDDNQIYDGVANLPSDSGKVYEYLYVINDEMEYLVEPRTFSLLPPDTWLSPMFFNGDAIPSMPVIVGVVDIPNDQGGKVAVEFNSSTVNVSYSIWMEKDGGGLYAMGSFNAIQDTNYSYIALTLGDSTASEIHWSTYRVSAHSDNPRVFYMSEPMSGYSIDNLAPVVPGGIIAIGYEDRVEITWDDNYDKDFQYYAIYRSTDAEFNPDPMTVATYTTDTTFVNDTDVEYGQTYYYKIAAVDYAGNKSEFSEKAYALVTDVNSDIEIPTVYELGQNYPNPFNPSTVIKFSIPESGLVSLKVFNILGQEVATLVNEMRSVGTYEVSFDASNITTGMYIYRIQSGDFTSTKKMMLVK